jgi:hypothetical protein
VTCPDTIIQGVRPLKLCTTGAWLPDLKAIEARSDAAMPLRDRGRYAGAAAMPIHTAMPAMLQCPHSNTARFRERRAEGQREWAAYSYSLLATPQAPSRGVEA